MPSVIRYAALMFAAGLLFTPTARSQPDHIHAQTIGQHGYMDADWYICPSWDAFKKFNNLLKVDGEAAFVVGDRDCERVRDETEVVVEDTSVLWSPSAICVRPVGSPDCGWIIPGFVTTALCTPTYISREQTMTCVARTDRDNPRRPWKAGYSGSPERRGGPR